VNIQQFITPQNQSQQDMRDEWLSHLLYVNPVGINRILNKYGYSGRLEPQTREDTIEAIGILIEYNGTDAIRDLLMAQPEFDAIRELLTPKTKPYISVPINNINQVTQKPVMQNATGMETIDGIFDIPANDIIKGMLIFGILYLLTKQS
jgi:hypothetical protein